MSVERLVIVGDSRPATRDAIEAAGLQLVSRSPDAVLCHGGDGTLLRAEREWPGVLKVPLRAAARARPCATHALDAVLAELVAGTLVVEQLPLLALTVGTLRWRALNDVVLRNANPAVAVRFRVEAPGVSIEELCGDGLVIATPFGSSGYYRSVTRSTLAEGFGVAFNNCTVERAPLQLPDDAAVIVDVLRGPALVVRDNDARVVPVRDGLRFGVQLAAERASVAGLDALRCQDCRRSDDRPFNPH